MEGERKKVYAMKTRIYKCCESGESDAETELFIQTNIEWLQWPEMHLPAWPARCLYLSTQLVQYVLRSLELIT